jgi:hypothetical protein
MKIYYMFVDYLRRQMLETCFYVFYFSTSVEAFECLIDYNFNPLREDNEMETSINFPLLFFS